MSWAQAWSQWPAFMKSYSLCPQVKRGYLWPQPLPPTTDTPVCTFCSKDPSEIAPVSSSSSWSGTFLLYQAIISQSRRAKCEVIHRNAQWAPPLKNRSPSLPKHQFLKCILSCHLKVWFLGDITEKCIGLSWSWTWRPSSLCLHAVFSPPR